MTKGINLGSGKNWSNAGWISLDEIGGNFLDSKSELPAPDRTVENIYSCHFFEHIDDKTAKNLFQESCRVLKNNGIMRVVVPDTEKIIRKLLSNDYAWFINIFGTGRSEWAKYGIEKNIVNSCLHILANYDYYGPKGFFRGPPKLQKEEVIFMARNFETKDFCEWVFSHIPKNSSIKTQHINWWTFSKFDSMMKSAGFRDVYSSSFMESMSEEMLKKGKFDDEKPNRRHFSLYVEARKWNE